MNEKINVAVFPCGSEVGLEIWRALKFYRQFRLIGLSSVADHGKFVFENYYGDLPLYNAKGFLLELAKVIEREKISFLLPAMDEVGYFLKKNEEALDCTIVYPELKIAEVIRKKSSTYEYLSNIVETPFIYKNISDNRLSFPLFMKPDIGYGGRGAKKIENTKELNFNISEENIFIEYLPGDEYTIDCFSSLESDLLFSGARKRSRVRMGISVGSQSIEDQAPFNEIAIKINNKLKMKGLWFFQLKKDAKGKLKLLEVAGRVSGSMALYRGLGINFIASDLFQRLGNEVSFLTLIDRKASLDRSFDCKLDIDIEFDTVYCDLDDCLIIDQKINTVMIKFLYGCRNQGKELILLTRHKRDLNITLGKYKIQSLFDELIHIPISDKPKSSFIDKAKNPIFIDDSYKERSEVSVSLGIPTFSPDAIELIDY